MNTINIDQLKSIVNYFIDNNNKLTEAGKRKISMNIQGDAGLGKTTLLQEIAEERGMVYNKLNISMLEELGDLVGIPVKEFKMVNSTTGEEKWVAEKLLDHFINLHYTVCEDCASRMSYSIPSWVPKDDVPSMLVLDDFSRKN